MLAFFINALALFAGGGSTAEGGFAKFWDTYMNYPGFEIWKFVNLALFVFVIIYLLKKPLSAAFKARREEIRAELIKAEEERQAALAKLTEVEGKLAAANAEIEAIRKEAREEIEAEKQRLAAQAEAEAAKIREQTAGEVTRIGQVAKLELRRFAVSESLRLAEERLQAEVTPETDSRLIKSGIQAIGGLN